MVSSVMDFLWLRGDVIKMNILWLCGGSADGEAWRVAHVEGAQY